MTAQWCFPITDASKSERSHYSCWETQLWVIVVYFHDVVWFLCNDCVSAWLKFCRASNSVMVKNNCYIVSICYSSTPQITMPAFLTFFKIVVRTHWCWNRELHDPIYDLCLNLFIWPWITSSSKVLLFSVLCVISVKSGSYSFGSVSVKSDRSMDNPPPLFSEESPSSTKRYLFHVFLVVGHT